MLDLRETIQLGASLAKNFGEATNAVGVRVTEENPFRVLQAIGDSAEADSDVFAQFFRRDEPRRDWIKCFVSHNELMMPMSFRQRNQAGFEHEMYQQPDRKSVV